MSWREQLQNAIDRAHLRTPDPLACRWCGCRVVVPEYRALLGWIPVSCHYMPDLASACPVLAGGLETFLCWLDLNEALAREGLPLAHYAEPADVALAAI